MECTISNFNKIYIYTQKQKNMIKSIHIPTIKITNFWLVNLYENTTPTTNIS